MGRELSGAPFRQPEWSALALIEVPEYVSRVHDAFVDAGADVITNQATPSYRFIWAKRCSLATVCVSPRSRDG